MIPSLTPRELHAETLRQRFLAASFEGDATLIAFTTPGESWLGCTVPPCTVPPTAPKPKPEKPAKPAKPAKPKKPAKPATKPKKKS